MHTETKSRHYDVAHLALQTVLLMKEHFPAKLLPIGVIYITYRADEVTHNFSLFSVVAHLKLLPRQATEGEFYGGSIIPTHAGF